VQNRVVHIRQGVLRRQDQVVLQDVHFDLFAGEFVYLIGKTGAGKSSFIKGLYGEWAWQAEQVWVAGEDLLKLRKSRLHLLRRQLGVIFQEFFLLREKTVFENLDFVLRATGWRKKGDRRDRIAAVLEDVGLSALGFRYPAQLSGGEQQRLAIARALLNEPQLILADEPAGNLDPETSDEITSLIRTLARANKSAVIFATHNYGLIERFPSPIIQCRDQTLQLLDHLTGTGG
jgi:cell division transport system ATP-binding protein